MALQTSMQTLYSSKIWRLNMLHCRNFLRNTYRVPSIISGSIHSGIFAARFIQKIVLPTTDGSADLDAEVSFCVYTSQYTCLTPKFTIMNAYQLAGRAHRQTAMLCIQKYRNGVSCLFCWCLCHIVLSVSCSLVVTCWERQYFLAILYLMFSCVFETFQYGIFGQVWYLVV